MRLAQLPCLVGQKISNFLFSFLAFVENGIYKIATSTKSQQQFAARVRYWLGEPCYGRLRKGSTLTPRAFLPHHLMQIVLPEGKLVCQGQKAPKPA